MDTTTGQENKSLPWGRRNVIYLPTNNINAKPLLTHTKGIVFLRAWLLIVMLDTKEPIHTSKKNVTR